LWLAAARTNRQLTAAQPPERKVPQGATGGEGRSSRHA
jgi:hypothetical protein